jgi:hypothetical protein
MILIRISDDRSIRMDIGQHGKGRKLVRLHP